MYRENSERIAPDADALKWILRKSKALFAFLFGSVYTDRQRQCSVCRGISHTP